MIIVVYSYFFDKETFHTIEKKINAGYQQTVAIDIHTFAKGIYTLKAGAG